MQQCWSYKKQGEISKKCFIIIFFYHAYYKLTLWLTLDILANLCLYLTLPPCNECIILQCNIAINEKDENKCYLMFSSWNSLERTVITMAIATWSTVSCSFVLTPVWPTLLPPNSYKECHKKLKYKEVMWDIMAFYVFHHENNYSTKTKNCHCHQIFKPRFFTSNLLTQWDITQQSTVNGNITQQSTDSAEWFTTNQSISTLWGHYW
jgi:hypothetical protein